MTKLTKLTRDQEAMLPVIRDEWLTIGLSTKRIDRADAQGAVRLVYECAGLPAPRAFVFLRSPLEGAIGAAMMAQVWDQVRDQVRAQVWAQVGDQVRAQVRDQVRAQVRDQVGAQVRDQVRAQVWDQVGAQVRDQVRRAAYGVHDASWLSFYDTFSRFAGLAEKARGLMALARVSGWVWPFQNVAIITDRPSKIALDAERRLHCEDGPAIAYEDGFTVHAWRGQRIPAEWVENRATLTPKAALTWGNIEQRRAACEILGWHNILRELGASVVNRDDDPEIGELVEVTIPDVGREKFLRVLCGTGREFALPVPPEMKTALEAQSWTWGLDAKSFIRPEIRT